MARHLKTSTILGLKKVIDHFVPPSEISTLRTRGVRYFVPVVAIRHFSGTMNAAKDGRKYRKHIIVRRYPRQSQVLQLYTYHFPKTWSAACVANRELIKTAQKLAHALEHDYSPEGIEWRLRFFHHYFHVVKGGAKPEPGLKPYTRFYQYVYVSIYRDLKSAAQQAVETATIDAQQPTAEQSLLSAPCVSAESPSPITISLSPLSPSPLNPEDVSFVPIDPRPLRSRRTYPLNALLCRSFSALNP